MRRLPIRVRLTLAFAAVMAILFAGIAVSLYTSSSSALLDELDSGLRSRAEALEAEAPREPSLTEPTKGLIESNEVFAQIVSLDGHIIRSSPNLATALLDGGQLARVGSARFFQRQVPGVAGVSRLLAMPLDDQSTQTVLIVGTTMSDRSDALRNLKVFLAVTGPLAILLASIAGWGVAGLALRPVERMRQQASAISASGMDRRLSLPPARDEIHRLAETLNDMLGRLDSALKAERRFVNDASHELRTPLTALKAELDVALSRPRPAEELLAALRSASEEADRLARLADDVLVLARSSNGRLPLHRAPVAIDQLLDASAGLFRAHANAAGVGIETAAPAVQVVIDPTRVRQAVDNLLANALRFSPSGTTIRLEAEVGGGQVTIAVSDQGPGFGSRHPPTTADGSGNGLGLAIVLAVAVGHGGTVTTDNDHAGGASVVMTLKADAGPAT